MRSYKANYVAVGSATSASQIVNSSDGLTYGPSTGIDIQTVALRNGGDGVLKANYFAGAGTATVATGQSTALYRRTADGYFLITGSRREYKKNIKELTEGLSVINSLSPVKFKWKKEYIGPDHSNDAMQSIIDSSYEYGFIVEDVAEVDTNLVSYMDDNDSKEPTPRMWQQNGVIALLVKAIQELSAEVEALKAAK